MFAKLKRKRYPKLSIITESSTKIKLVTPETLKKLIKPKTQNEFDSISYSGSEISDVFEDEHKDIFTTKIQSQKLSKLKDESNKSFTAEFTKTILELRKELNIGDNIMSETMDGIRTILNEKREPPPISQHLQDRLEEILKDREFFYSSSSDISDEEIKNEIRGSNGNTGKPFKVYYKELKSNEKVELNLTNTQEESQDKSIVSWQTLNFSRLKCDKWLNKQKYSKLK